MASLREGLVSFDVWKNEYSCMNVQKLRNINMSVTCGEQAIISVFE